MRASRFCFFRPRRLRKYRGPSFQISNAIPTTQAMTMTTCMSPERKGEGARVMGFDTRNRLKSPRRNLFQRRPAAGAAFLSDWFVVIRTAQNLREVSFVAVLIACGRLSALHFLQSFVEGAQT